MTEAGRGQDCDSTILFAFFLFGLGAVLLGDRFLPWLALRAQERVSLQFLLLTMLTALLSGGSILGLYLIPSAAFIHGSVISLLVLRFLSRTLDNTVILSALLTAAAVPVFFCIAFLGLKNASLLLCSLRRSGSRAERAAIRVCFLRWAIFAIFLLCFFFLHGIPYR